MLTLITTDAKLRQYIPNVFSTVEGETSLLDKMTPSLELAERWASSIIPVNFNSPDDIVLQIVATEAFRRAVPSLDLVLTPNGFGIVSNDNIAPVSRDRIKSLTDQLEDTRDTLIDQYIRTVATLSTLENYPQYAAWVRTTFRGFDAQTCTGDHTHRLSRWLADTDRIRMIEYNFADSHISHPLMQQLIAHTHLGTLTYDEQTLVTFINSAVADYLKDRMVPVRLLRQAVNFIRTTTSLNAVWKDTDTAALFTDHDYENTKSASAFFL